MPEASYRHATVLTLTVYGQNDANTADAVTVFSHVKKTNFNLKDISISKKRPTFD